tara:strand:- start:183 stop:593 length:411 start_codon:yes stop_codon:yes gene_type:complete
MGLKRTKLLDIQSITGIATVGIFTVGVTDCTGPVGVASTSYIRGVVAHNTGVGTAVASISVYPAGAARAEVTGYGVTAYRLARVNLSGNETFFFEPNYPIVMVDRESLVLEVTPPAAFGSGIGSMVNFQILGDTDL